MTDKVEQIRKKIEEERVHWQKMYEDSEPGENMTFAYCAKKNICNDFIAFINSLQEEPVRKVWHDSNKEQPKCGSNVVIWSPTLETGELITKCAKVFENRIWAYLDDLLKM